MQDSPLLGYQEQINKVLAGLRADPTSEVYFHKVLPMDRRHVHRLVAWIKKWYPLAKIIFENQEDAP